MLEERYMDSDSCAIRHHHDDSADHRPGRIPRHRPRAGRYYVMATSRNGGQAPLTIADDVPRRHSFPRAYELAQPIDLCGRNGE